jgi:hypothetical protein
VLTTDRKIIPCVHNNNEVVFMSLFNLLWLPSGARDSNTRAQTPAIKKQEVIVAEMVEETLTF